MSISFKSWYSGSSDQASITCNRIYEKKMAGPDGNGFAARTANPQKFTGEGEYLDRLNHPAHYSPEAQYARQIADPHIIQPKQTKKPSNLFDIFA